MLTPLGDDGNYHRIVQIAVGQQHGLLLTDEGVVYSWGGKNEGQLGRTPSNQEMCQKPCPVGDALRDKIIVQIACGLRHCLALTQDGKLYSWGHNKAGQLGLPKSALHMSRDWIIHPSRVGGDSEDMNVKSCSCGPESSACVTTNGEVVVGKFVYSNFLSLFNLVPLPFLSLSLSFVLSVEIHQDCRLTHSCTVVTSSHKHFVHANAHASARGRHSRVQVSFLMVAERGSSSSLRVDALWQTCALPQTRRRLQTS